MILYCKDTSAFYQIKTKYTNENGLPQNSVKAIAEDNYGFIWLATESGLVRFDGKNFRLFDKFEDASITRILNIFKIDNRLFVVDDKLNILEINAGFLKKVDISYDEKSTIISNSIHQRLHFGFWSSKGAFNKDFKAELLLDIDRTVSITKDSILWKENNLPVQSFKLQIEDPHKSQFFVLNKQLYCFNSKGENPLIKVMPDSYIPTSIYGELNIKSFEADVVVLTNQGSQQSFLFVNQQLYHLSVNVAGEVYAKLLISNCSFDINIIRSIYYDEVRLMVFIGSAVDGLSVFTKKQFFTLKISDRDVKSNIFYDIVLRGKSQILSGSGYLFDMRTGEHDIPRSLKNFGFLNYSRLSQLSGGEYLFGTNNALKRFDNNLQIVDSIDNFEANYFIAGNTTLGWAVGNGPMYGLYRLFENTYGRMQYEKVSDEKFEPILYEEGDSVWCVSDGFLRIFDNVKKELRPILQIDEMSIRFMMRERGAGLWLGTFGDGLMYFDGTTLFSLPIDNKGYLKSVNAIQQDHHNNFWISTNNGLFQTSKQSLLDYIDGKQKSVLYLRYTKNNGFYTNEFNGRGNRTSLQLPNGFLAFSSLDGIVYFHPDSINTVFPDHPIILDQIIVDGLPLIEKENESIHFSKNYHSIILLLASSEVAYEGNIQYEYKLNNNEWAPMTANYVEFNELPVGKNVISFRKFTGFGEQYNLLSIPFMVEAYWWQTIYFWIIIVMFLLLFLWLFTKLRTQVLTRRNRELTANVAERTQILNHKNMQLQMSEEELRQQLEVQISINETITHDIKTPLKYMAIYIRKIKENMLLNKTPNIEDIEALMMSVNSIYDFTVSITTNIKSNVKGKSLSKVSMYMMIDEMINLFQNAIEERELTILNQIEADMIFTTSNNTLKTIIHNLLDNAIKNNRQSEIVLSALNEIEDFQFFIWSKNKIDEGSIEKYNQYFHAAEGIDRIKIGLGFKTIKNLIKKINATITLDIDQDRLKITLRLVK